MAPWRRTTACERAAQWVSLELDGETSRLERAALARHLQRCETCRGASAEIGGLTRAIRSAPAEERRSPVAIALPRSRRRMLRAGFVAAAAAGAVAAAVAVASGLTASPSSNKPAAWALGFVSQQQQIEFVRTHVSTEPILDGADVPPADSLGWRALR